MIEVCEMKKKRKIVGYMIRVSRDEAISLIQTLAKQITTNDNNSHRTEYNTIDGLYFSIGVVPEERRK